MDVVTRNLDGRAVLVTGGTGGIGQATCRSLARAGASVVVADIDQGRCDALTAELEEIGSAAGGHLGLRVDVTSEADNEDMVQAVLDRYGRVDALVTCAGILRHGRLAPKRITEVTTEEFDRVLAVNLRGVFLSNRAVLKPMLERRSGIIINISSVQALSGRAYDGPYCASKFAVNGLTQSLAEEVRSEGIKVMAVMPAAIDTPMWDQNGPISSPAHALPPERVADLILFLLQQPEDTVLLGTVISPLGARKRRKREPA